MLTLLYIVLQEYVSICFFVRIVTVWINMHIFFLVMKGMEIQGVS